MKDIHTHNLAAGTDAIINLPFDMSVTSPGRIVDMMRQGCSYSIGIHPWSTEGVSDFSEAFAALEDIATHNQIVAIGEAGMDALRGAPLDVQRCVFEQQVALSEKLRKPLIIHAVKTHNDILSLRKVLQPSQRWLIHGFRGKPQQAQQLLDAGFDISLGEKFNPETARIIPEDRLFTETDMSALSIDEIRYSISKVRCAPRIMSE